MSPKNLLSNRKVKTQNHILGSSLLTFPLFHSWVPRLFLGFQLYFPRALGGGFRALPSFPRGLLAVFLKNIFIILWIEYFQWVSIILIVKSQEDSSLQKLKIFTPAPAQLTNLLPWRPPRYTTDLLCLGNFAVL